MACFDVKSGLHYVQRAKWCEKSGKLRIVSIRNELSEFSSKSMNDCVLRVAGHLSALIAVCTTFGVLNGVKRAENFGMPLSGTKYHSFRPNR
jgi:glycine cleavage system H lipoate-binding protein